MNNILKQTIANMRTQPLLTGLTIAGTALAICLIMIVMMTREAQIADYGNEPYRSRTLYVRDSKFVMENGNYNFDGAIHRDIICAIFRKLKTPEAVAVHSSYINDIDVYAPGGEIVSVAPKTVNADFFRVYSLRFLEGKPFTEEECASNLTAALLSRSTCRKVFGQEKGVVGKVFIVANHEYRVAGVVEDVSPLMRSAYADIWVPASDRDDIPHPLEKSNIRPKYNHCADLLAKSPADFPKIRREVERLVKAYNKTHTGVVYDLIEQPDTKETAVNRDNTETPDMQAVYLRYLLIFGILLIVPAINIASMTQSRLRQREEEIGVRRTFGAKRSTILWQVIVESLIQTLLAGILGLLLSFVACIAAAQYIFPKVWGEESVTMSLDPSILFSPQLYGWAFFFCLVLNALSSLVPAWRASRGNIVEALK